MHRELRFQLRVNLAQHVRNNNVEEKAGEAVLGSPTKEAQVLYEDVCTDLQGAVEEGVAEGGLHREELVRVVPCVNVAVEELGTVEEEVNEEEHKVVHEDA